jgi:hypothetical protein
MLISYKSSGLWHISAADCSRLHVKGTRSRLQSTPSPVYSRQCLASILLFIIALCAGGFSNIRVHLHSYGVCNRGQLIPLRTETRQAQCKQWGIVCRCHCYAMITAVQAVPLVSILPWQKSLHSQSFPSHHCQKIRASLHFVRSRSMPKTLLMRHVFRR